MGLFNLGTQQASVLWIDSHRIHADAHNRALDGLPTGDQLAQALMSLPEGPTSWIVDDLLVPTLILRDIVDLPAGDEAKDAFFRWRFNQHLALDAPHAVQALPLGAGAWLLAGIPEALRDAWVQEGLRVGRPIHHLQPRWLWAYNHLAPSLQTPGILLSLSPHPDGTFTGTLVAWGRTLTLVRQWAEPAPPESWVVERVLPTSAFLQREARTPYELWIWGAPNWPQGTLQHRLIPMDIPSQEAL